MNLGKVHQQLVESSVAFVQTSAARAGDKSDTNFGTVCTGVDGTPTPHGTLRAKQILEAVLRVDFLM